MLLIKSSIPVLMLLWTGNAAAHLLGAAAWCISTSPVHFECFYDTPEACEKMLKMRPRRALQFPTEPQSCEPYPADRAEYLKKLMGETNSP
jgi:hypothetical protein